MFSLKNGLCRSVPETQILWSMLCRPHNDHEIGVYIWANLFIYSYPLENVIRFQSWACRYCSGVSSMLARGKGVGELNVFKHFRGIILSRNTSSMAQVLGSHFLIFYTRFFLWRGRAPHATPLRSAAASSRAPDSHVMPYCLHFLFCFTKAFL